MRGRLHLAVLLWPTLISLLGAQVLGAGAGSAFAESPEREFFASYPAAVVQGLPGEPAVFASPVTNPEALATSVEWDYDGDGTINEVLSFGETGHFVFSAAGKRSAFYTVRYRSGQSYRGEIEVSIGIGLPAPIIAPSAAAEAGNGVKNVFALLLSAPSAAAYGPVVRLYRNLTDVQGVSAANITVLILGDRPAEFPADITSIKGTKAAFGAALGNLGERADGDDILLVAFEGHGNGVLGRDPLNAVNRGYHGYWAVQPMVNQTGNPDEFDYRESDLELSLFVGGGLKTGADFHAGLNQWAYIWYWNAYVYRWKYVSHFQNLSINDSAPVSDNDEEIEKLIDYTLGDYNKNGTIETELGEIWDYDGDGVMPYDRFTGVVDEDDWGGIDGLQTPNPNYGTHSPIVNYSKRVYDDGLDDHADLDINPVSGVDDVDGTDTDNDGLIDGIDLNDDGDQTDWVAFNETMSFADGTMTDDEVAALFNPIQAGRKIFINNACYSGGLIADISGPNTIAISASRDETESFTGLIFDFFTEAFGVYKNEADVDHNNVVTLVEAFNHVSLHPHMGMSEGFDYYQYDDNGDRIWHYDPLPAGGDGALGIVSLVPDIDSDGDGSPDSTDQCPNNAQKTVPGSCGCSVAETDTDGDGTPNCIDLCPSAAIKTVPGTCGCSVADTDTDGDSAPNCTDGCPNAAWKTSPGICGCSASDSDSDGDGTADCNDGCTEDADKTEAGSCGCGADESDADADGTPDCVDLDDDNDSVTDSQELLDGSDPSDRGSSVPRLSATVCSEWNGYLSLTESPVWNVLEHSNLGAQSIEITSTLYRQNGSAAGQSTFAVLSGAQTDLLVHDLAGWERDHYGKVCSTVHTQTAGEFDGRMVYYKTQPGRNDRFQYAFAMPYINGTKGPQALPFNTFHPSLDPADLNDMVANWIQLTNLNETPETGELIFYDRFGDELRRRRIALDPGARSDFAAHDFDGRTIGTIAWLPTHRSSLFQLRNVRYVYDNPSWLSSFDTAFQIEGLTGSSGRQAAPVDTEQASSILEVANLADELQTINITIFSSDGALKHARALPLPPRGAEHIIVDTLMPHSKGAALIEGGLPGSIMAVAMQYGRTDSGALTYMYGTAARQALGSVLTTSYNTFLGQGCTLKLVNVTDVEQVVQARMTRYDGTVMLAGKTYTLPPHGSTDDAVCSLEEPNRYGVVTIQPEHRNSIIASMIRLGPFDDYRFPTPARE